MDISIIPRMPDRWFHQHEAQKTEENIDAQKRNVPFYWGGMVGSEPDGADAIRMEATEKGR